MPRPTPIIIPGQGSMGSSFNRKESFINPAPILELIKYFQEKQAEEAAGISMAKMLGIPMGEELPAKEMPPDTSVMGETLPNQYTPPTQYAPDYSAIPKSKSGQTILNKIVQQKLEPTKFEHAPAGSMAFDPKDPTRQIAIGEKSKDASEFASANEIAPDETSPTGYRRFIFNKQTGKYDRPDLPAIPPAHVTRPPISVSDISGMRKEFEGSQIYKDYVTVKPQEEKIKQAYNSIGKNNVAVDQTIITVLNKMLDPTSVVRESEYARTPQNLSLLNRASGAIEKYGIGGAGLTDSDRKAILDMAMKFGDITTSYYKEHEGAFAKIAKHYEIPKHLVITTPSFKFGEAKVKSAAEMSDDELMRKINGN